MPKWICADCGHEFWGWHKKGESVNCSECGGVLERVEDRGSGDAA